MSQLLRLQRGSEFYTYCLLVSRKAFSSSACRDCDILRDTGCRSVCNNSFGFASHYSSSAQTKIAFVHHRQKWKTKKVPLKKEKVHSELVDVLTARVFQLQSTHGQVRHMIHQQSLTKGVRSSAPEVPLYTAIQTNARHRLTNHHGVPLISRTTAMTFFDTGEEKWMQDFTLFKNQLKVEETLNFHDTLQTEDEIKVSQQSSQAATESEQLEDRIEPNIVSYSLLQDSHKSAKAAEKVECHSDGHPVGIASAVETKGISPEENAVVHLSEKKKKTSTKKSVKDGKKKWKDLSKAEKWAVNPLKMSEIFNQDLKTFVNVCIFAGLPNLAHSAIRFYTFQHKLQNSNSNYMITDIQVFSTLMHAWAKQDSLDLISKLFSLLKDQNLQPDLQCYVACLECLARQENFDIELGERVQTALENDGYNTRDIFNQCVFNRDERSYVMKALKTLNADYKPNPPPPRDPYIGPLLEDLNNPLPPDQRVERNPYHGVLTAEELKEKAEIQLQMEIANHVTVESILDQKKHASSKMKKLLEDAEKQWRKDLLTALGKKIQNLEKRANVENGICLYPYLKLFEPQEYITIMLREVEKLASESDTYSPSASILWKELGLKVYTRYIIESRLHSKLTKKMTKIYSLYVEKMVSEDLDHVSHRDCWLDLVSQHNDGPTLDVPLPYWSPHIIRVIGKMLFEIIMKFIKVNKSMLGEEKKTMIPAFYTVYRNYGFVVTEEIKPHPLMVKLYQAADKRHLTFETGFLPSLIPPVPWFSVNVGANFFGTVKFIRLPDLARKGQMVKLQDIPSKQVQAIFDSLNILGACPWIINKPMLDLIVGIFNNKGNPDLDIPCSISELSPMPRLTSKLTSEERSRILAERLQLKRERAEMYSLWCNELYKLSVANKFRDEIFWFPYNIDFRGRTYPCPPHFNHLGSDITRSILLFAKGKPLGEKGLDWLKIHLVNLTGLKKRSSNADRLKFANKNMSEILDSADNPLNGSKWWQNSDDPWQTLACCKVIAEAVRSPNPSEYNCHFPVHQDGSCNGLQHYAALGRDQIGAESINLHPFDVPQDVYSDVVEMVEMERAKDAMKGLKIAEMLEGCIHRKVIKQTVMTTVYGVTRYGARHQILKQLKELPEIEEKYIWPACGYLTEKTFFCLSEMFTTARNIQDWFILCAQLITNLCNKPVDWITPLGLPVVQPYHKKATSQRWGVSITDSHSSFEKPNSFKQKNGFPPNFIHSLDASHMMLTALFCLRVGITFASVHDCFWTHPSDVEMMNKICREQFVNLHSQPILEDLSQYFIKMFVQSSKETEKEYLRSLLSQIPTRGKFQMENVLKSTYFFS